MTLFQCFSRNTSPDVLIRNKLWIMSGKNSKYVIIFYNIQYYVLFIVYVCVIVVRKNILHMWNCTHAHTQSFLFSNKSTQPIICRFGLWVKNEDDFRHKIRQEFMSENIKFGRFQTYKIIMILLVNCAVLLCHNRWNLE